MNLIELKSQARRLQAFLQSKPTHAQALAQGKQSACLEAIAAVHGARNWNVLQASCPSDDSTPDAEPIRALTPKILFDGGAPEQMDPVFGGLLSGQVHYLIDAADKAQSVVRELARAVPEGYSVTVLHHGGRAYHHLALCFAGVSTSPARQHEAGSALLLAPAVALDTAGWRLTQAVLGTKRAEAAVDQALANVLQTLELRASRGAILVIDDIPQLQTSLGTSFSLLVGGLAKARDNGARVVLVARDRKDLDALRELLPPVMEEVNHGSGRLAPLH